MDVFQYKGVDSAGRFNTGKMDASNIADLEMRLNQIGLDLVSFKNLGKTGTQIRTFGIKKRDLITLCFHLEQTSKAGVPILESLGDIRDSSDNHRLREILAAMYESISGGQKLSEAMSAYPSIFPPVFTALVSVGEESGEMSTIFFQLGENIKWQDEQTAIAKKLMIYPLFVGSIVAGVIFFLMIYLVPQLTSFITSTGQEIPVQTKILIFVSDLFVNYWAVMIATPIILCILLSIGIKTNPKIHYKVDELKLRVPLFGSILRKIILARLVSILAIMYSSGITIIECISTSEQAVGNEAMRSAVHHVGLQIADGSTLSNSFESAEMFPPLVLRMVRIGESTGELEAALRSIHYFYTRDVKESIQNLQTMIEPGITIVLGIVVGWVMFAVLGPVYDLISKVNV